nr:MAG TPA: hypothetical protein [Caudoviricetes sp.]
MNQKCFRCFEIDEISNQTKSHPNPSSDHVQNRTTSYVPHHHDKEIK